MVEGEYTRKESTGRPCCKQARAEVLAACILVLERHLANFDKDPTTIEGAVRQDTKRAAVNLLKTVHPAASALEALLREARLEALRIGHFSVVWRGHGLCDVCEQIAELEKARAEGKG